MLISATIAGLLSGLMAPILYGIRAMIFGGTLSKNQGSLPNQWIPRRNRFIAVPEFPMLGTGKLNLCALRKLAAIH
jgi:hypothetical protein